MVVSTILISFARRKFALQPIKSEMSVYFVAKSSMFVLYWML